MKKENYKTVLDTIQTICCLVGAAASIYFMRYIYLLIPMLVSYE